MASSRRSAKSADPAGVDAVVDAVRRAVAAHGAAGVPAGTRDRPPAAPASTRDVVVAYSGGRDSTVLLHAAVRALGASRVVAAHVHHGLQPAADAWPAHCAAQAAALGVRFEALRVDAAPARGDSVEAWARGVRYRALAAAAVRCGAGVVLTGHHADDQAETLLMRIARGTGVDGLAGIRAHANIEGVAVLRPLLALPRAALERWAARHGLAWVEDPTNADVARLRNAVRHAVLPAIDAAAPAFRANLARLASHAAAAQDAVAALARIDLDAARRGDAARDAQAGLATPVRSAAVLSAPVLSATVLSASVLSASVLSASVLAALPDARRLAALRLWLATLGLPAPSEARLRAIDRQVLRGAGAYADLRHEGWRLRRYRDAVFAAPDDAEAVEPARPVLRWCGEAALSVPGFDGRLLFEPRSGEGVSRAWLHGRALAVTPGASSARLRAAEGGRTRTLKNLYQEHGVPAWARAGLPLVWTDGRLLFAAGLGMDRGAWPSDGERVRLRWEGDGRPVRGLSG